MTGDRPRVVFDCNIFFQAFLTPRGPAFGCVRTILEHRAVLLVSRTVLAEARDVLGRPFVREQFPTVTDARVDAFLAELVYLGEFWRDVPRVLTCQRDPEDESYLNLAAAGAADYLVTRDQDLLSLPSGHSPDAQQLRQVTRNRLQIVTPTEFLRQMEQH